MRWGESALQLELGRCSLVKYMRRHAHSCVEQYLRHHGSQVRSPFFHANTRVRRWGRGKVQVPTARRLRQREADRPDADGDFSRHGGQRSRKG